MRYAIISDIHANLAAFEAVLEDIELQGGVDTIWHLGDIVNYGPDPHECIELLAKYDNVCLVGNNDLAAMGKISTEVFNMEAGMASRWSGEQLTRDERGYLQNLPQRVESGDFTLVHASPREPVWEYVISSQVAKENFSHFQTRFCLVGHSHKPLVYEMDENGNCSGRRFSAEITLGEEVNRLIINPGAVGQPRDGNPKAAYAIYDSDAETIKPFRVDYDIEQTQKRMKKFGLPAGLIARLSVGV